MATGFPFGLWTCRRPITLDEQLVVWPRIVDLKSVLRIEGNRYSFVGGFVDRAGNDGDILAARNYRQGDSLRRIHWAHTARRDTLIVCERQTTARRNVVISVDAQAFAAAGDRQQELLDWGMRIAASLVREFHAHACDLACDLGRQRFSVPLTAAGLHRAFDRMAAYVPAAECSDPRPDRRVVRREVSSPLARFRLPRRSPQAGQLQIQVTTGKRWSEAMAVHGEASIRGGDFRVVVLDCEPAAVREADSGARPWIRLNIDHDLEYQLQRSWEKHCHDDWLVG